MMVEKLPKFHKIENPVRTFVSKRIIGIDSEESVQDAAKRMVEFNISSLVVVEDDNDEIIGLITNEDLKRRVIAKGLDSRTKVKEIVTEELITIDIDTPVKDALGIMASKDIKHIPVEEDGDIVGMLTFSDLIDFEKQKLETHISRE